MAACDLVAALAPGWARPEENASGGRPVAPEIMKIAADNAGAAGNAIGEVNFFPSMFARLMVTARPGIAGCAPCLPAPAS